MCRLFGASLADPGAFRPEWLDAFSLLADSGIVSRGSEPGHRDGWGVAGMAGDAPVVLARNPKSMRADPSAVAAMQDARRSRNPNPLLAHLRKASPGLGVSLANTHPFLINGCLFCHNGSLREAARLPVSDPGCIAGTTDSERWFAFLLEQAGSAPPEAFPGALAKAMELARSYSGATAWNFLLVRESRLYVYRETSAPGIPGPHGLFVATRDHITLCCSEPLVNALGGAPWAMLANRELLTLEGGQVTGRRTI
jgi:predicted glutamine amidotransferase